MSSSLSFQIPAIRIHQREEENQAVYVGTVKASEFFERAAERFVIDYYKKTESGEHGYQRNLTTGAIEKVKSYVLQETKHPLFPTAMLMNSRTPLEFDVVSGSFGNLKICDVLYIIDGQHRFEAWKSMMHDNVLRNNYGDFEFPLVILSGFDERKEVEQFFVINSRQKKIKTDLAQRNFLKLATNDETSGLIPEKSKWQLYATKIVDALNEEVDGVWEDKIILPNDGPDLRKAKIISQTSFVSSLKPFFVGRNAVFSVKEGQRPELDKWVNFLSEFWGVVAEVYPEAIENPKDYSLLKTVGVSALHLFFSKLGSDMAGERNILDPDMKKNILKQAKSSLEVAAGKKFPLQFWRTNASETTKAQGKYAGAYSSAVGHRRIVSGIMLGF